MNDVLYTYDHKCTKWVPFSIIAQLKGTVLAKSSTQYGILWALKPLGQTTPWMFA